MLHGIADALTVQFPWGSLLEGVLGREEAVLAGMAAVMKPGASGTVLLSVVPRDGVEPIPAWGRLSLAYERNGLELVEMRPASAAEVATAESSWAKRLRAGRERPVTLLRIRRAVTR